MWNRHTDLNSNTRNFYTHILPDIKFSIRPDQISVFGRIFAWIFGRILNSTLNCSGITERVGVNTACAPHHLVSSQQQQQHQHQDRQHDSQVLSTNGKREEGHNNIVQSILDKQAEENR